MCGFCIAAALKDPCNLDGFGSVTTELVYEDSWAETAMATGTGQSHAGTLDEAGDTDLFQIDLSAGEAVALSLSGTDHTDENGHGAVQDPLIRVFDADGKLIASNDDAGFGAHDSALTLFSVDGGSYVVQVDTYDASGSGDYLLSFDEAMAAASPLDAIRGDKILNDDDTILVYFAEADDTYLGIFDADGMTEYERTQMFSVFEGIEEFADIDFEMTLDREAADLEVATGDLGGGPGGTTLGFFNFPKANGDGSFGIINNTFDGYSDEAGGSMDTGGFMYGVVLHEIGHGLGLGHPHDTGNGSDVMLGVNNDQDMGDFDLNQPAFTSMTYVEGAPETGAAPVDASNGHQSTYGAFDIAVLQEYYGANTTHASGDDVYMLHDNNDLGSGAGFYTTWDTGGIDEIRYDGTKDSVIELRAATLEYEEGGGGFLCYVDGVFAGRTIANGVVIENATSGDGNDLLIGNDVDNILTANAGNDTLAGLDGNDTLDAGIGSDTAVGGRGDDEILAGKGKDVVRGQGGDDMLSGGAGDDTIIGGGGSDDMDGGSNEDLMSGGGGNDTLDGNLGDDTLFGGSGNDTLSGGDGADWFAFSGGNDVITDYDAFSDLETIDLSEAVGINNIWDLALNHVTQVGDDLVIEDQNGSTLTILDATTAEIDPFEYVF